MWLCAPTLSVEVGSVGIPGCGVLNCLEETWEERWYRKRKEGGRAQYGAGTFEKKFFHPRVTSS